MAWESESGDGGHRPSTGEAQADKSVSKTAELLNPIFRVMDPLNSVRYRVTIRTSGMWGAIILHIGASESEVTFYSQR